MNVILRSKLLILITLSTVCLVNCTSPSVLEETGTDNLMELTVNEGTNLAVALSPDGQTLAFDVLGRIWLMPVQGGVATAITDSLGNARQPSWSPDGSQITFQGYWQGNWHIYTINRDGSNLRQMTTDEYDYREPHWSPDGTSLVFSSDKAGSYDIWKLDIVGEQLIPLTSDEGNEFGPTWAPDGRQLAYVSDDGMDRKVQIQDLETGTRKTGYSGTGKLSGITWSPSGDAILVNEHDKLQAGIKQVDLQTTAVTSLTGEEEDVFPFRHVWTADDQIIYTGNGKIQKIGEEGVSEVLFSSRIWMERKAYPRKKRDFDNSSEQPVKGIAWPVLHPDGQQVIFVALQDLWLRKADGTIEQITNDPSVQIMPAWSPDGRHLAYSSDKAGPFGLWVMNMDTREERLVLELGSSVSGLTWSPVGNYIAFTQSFGPYGGQLNILDVATSQITSLGEQLGSSVGTPTWSPDGNVIALTALDTYSSLYREGVNRIILFPANGDQQTPQKAPEHWSFGTRGNDGPLWSPDGRFMAIMGRGNLWLMPVDDSGNATGEATRLTEELSDAPSWSGDGKSLLYMATNQLKKIDIDTKESTIIPIEMAWKRKMPTQTTVIHAGGIIDGVKDEVISNMDIIIEGHRIKEVAPHMEDRETDVFIDASDAYIMPGLIDLHAHEGSGNGEKLGRTWLSWGVTTMRNPTGDPYDILNRREAIQSGKILGPRIYFTGPPIDGSRVFYAGTPATQSLDQVDMELRRARLLDYDLIKTYVRLPDPIQKKVVEEAHKMGLPVTSHELYPAVAFNTDGVEHVRGTSRRGFSSKLSETLRAYDDVTDMLAISGMTFTPTTAIYMGYNYVVARDPSVMEDSRLKELAELRYLASVSASTDEIKQDQETYDQLYANLIKMVFDVQRKGGQVVAGTDSPILPQGFALHIELENYQDAGLTPFEVLQTATINNARALNASDDLGSVEAGKLADLVIVEGNPLEDIRNARKTRMVIKNGESYSLEQLLTRPE